MKLILPICAMICTVLATLTALVFCMPMGANSTPEQIRTLKLWMGGLALLGIAGIGVGIFLIRTGQLGWAAVAGFVPTIIMGLILGISLLK